MFPRALAPARRRLFVLATAVTVALAGALTLAAPASAAPRTLEGVVRLVADAPGLRDAHGERGQQLVLVVGERAYEVRGRALAPNTRVRVSGLVSGNSVDVQSATTLAAASSSLPTSGTTNTLVMLVTWPGLTPDDVTPTGAAEQLFTEDDDWYREASYGALGLSGAVTPWMTITGPPGNACYAGSEAIMSQAKTAAVARGFTLGSYANFVVYFPSANGLPGADCGGAAGWAYVGAPNVWLNGYIDRHTTVHELGHNYGLSHSDSYICPGGGVAATGCTATEYGDYYDAMGNWSPGHFSASQKQILGWMGSGRTVDLTAGGSATLVPMAEQSTATHAARVRATTGRSYWLEYRQRTGYDSDLWPCCGWDGVLVHVDDATIGAPGQPDLIDVSPGDGLGAGNATLKAGGSWTSPEGYVFSVGTVTASGAQVTVTAPAGDSTAPTVTARTPASAGTGTATTTNVTATFSEPVQGLDGTSFQLAGPTGSTIGAAVAYSGTTRTATLNPTADLAPDTRYTATLRGGASAIRDLAGNSLAAETWTFTTGPAPRLTARSPAVGATAVSTVGNLSLTFSEPVLGVNGTTFTVTTPSGTVVPATVSYNATTRVATLNPTANLPADVLHTARITGGTTTVRDAAGNPLPSSTWTFTTGPAPTVTSRYPAGGQTGISRTANVAAVFSEAVQGVSTATATLRSSAGTAISAVVTYDATTRRLTLNPNSTLAARTTYTATLTGGATGMRDLAGNPLTTTRWSFTTGS